MMIEKKMITTMIMLKTIIRIERHNALGTWKMGVNEFSDLTQVRGFFTFAFLFFSCSPFFLPFFLFSLSPSYLLVYSDLTQVRVFFTFYLSFLFLPFTFQHNLTLLRSQFSIFHCHSCQMKITFTFSSIKLDRRLSLRPK